MTYWGGKERVIGTFHTPEQASAAYMSVKKDLDGVEISVLGAGEVDDIFDAAKQKALEAVDGIVPKKKKSFIECEKFSRYRLRVPETSPGKFIACYPHNPPSQAAAKHYQGEDMATMMHTEAPQFQHIVNFPSNYRKGDEERRCVMCGKCCSTTRPNGQAVSIPNQNKGVCTACDSIVWIHAASGLQIKWCKSCKNFKMWASFGHKGHLTKCMGCRDEQKKRYAQKKAVSATSAAVPDTAVASGVASKHHADAWPEKKRRKIHPRADATTAAAKKSKATSERGLPIGVQQKSTGEIESKIQ